MCHSTKIHFLTHKIEFPIKYLSIFPLHTSLIILKDEDFIYFFPEELPCE